LIFWDYCSSFCRDMVQSRHEEVHNMYESYIKKKI
jgi:hypothetical protein